MNTFSNENIEYDICIECGDRLDPWWVSNNCSCSFPKTFLEEDIIIDPNIFLEDYLDNDFKINQEVDLDGMILLDLKE